MGIAGSERNADYFDENLRDLARRLMGGRPFAAALLPELESAATAAATAYRAFGGFLEDTYEISVPGKQFVILEPAAAPAPRAPHELYAD